jgi:predicted MFS family arabinose efflux permease
MSKALPNEAEAGGGLMVAVIQLAITLGSSVGGLLFDGSGYRATFGASAAILVASAAIAVLASTVGRRNSFSHRALAETACLIG